VSDDQNGRPSRVDGLEVMLSVFTLPLIDCLFAINEDRANRASLAAPVEAATQYSSALITHPTLFLPLRTKRRACWLGARSNLTD